MSADPITNGHLDILNRIYDSFDEIIIAIGYNPKKTHAFEKLARVNLVKKVTANMEKVVVMEFEGLLIHFAYEQGADVIIRGVRNETDFSYEQNIHNVIDSQRVGIDTYLLFARPEMAHISSSAVRELHLNGGLIHELVPVAVKDFLDRHLANRHIIGITGVQGAGKSFVADALVEYCRVRKIEAHNIELDHLAHHIYDDNNAPACKIIREKIFNAFPECRGTESEDLTLVDRKVLGDIVFKDEMQMMKLNAIMKKPLEIFLQQTLKDKQGVIILNSALLCEARSLLKCNNRTLLVHANSGVVKERLSDRGLEDRQIEDRITSQFNAVTKENYIRDEIRRHGFGNLWTIYTDHEDKQYREEMRNIVFDDILRTLGKL